MQANKIKFSYFNFAIVLLEVICTCTSCNKNLYHPSKLNTPMFTEPYQFQGAISPRNVLASFTFSKQLGACFTYSWNNSIFTIGTHYGRQTEYYNFGLHYYKNFDKDMYYNLTVGIGNGYSMVDYYRNKHSNDFIITTEFYKSKYSLLFLQQGVYFINHRIDIDLSLRCVLLNFYNLQYKYSEETIKFNYPNNLPDTSIVKYDGTTKEYHLMIEPAITMKLKSKNELVNFLLQGKLSVPATNTKYSGYQIHLNEPYFNISIGLQIKIWKGLFRKETINKNNFD